MNRLLILIFSLTAVSSAFAETYKIDPDHSTAAFKIKHLAISTVPGRFTDLSGTVEFDPKNIAAAKAEAKINVSSINTEQKKRDEHLRSEDFFYVTKFPEMTFVSKEIKDITSDSFKVVGELTIRGVTKPVVLDVKYQGAAKDPWGNERAAFSASTKINRKDFGLTWNKVLETGALVVGEEATIDIEIEGIKQG